MTESTVERIFGDAELFVQAARTDDGNSGGMPVDRPAFPNQPQVKIKNARGMGQGRNNLTLDRDSMLVDLVVEGFTECNHVPLILNFDTAVVCIRAEPKFYGIEEVEASPIDEGAAVGLIFRPEEDCGSEDTFESLFDSPVVEAIGLKVKKGEHLGGTLESDDSALLFQGKRRNPYGDEPVLAEGQTVVGVAEYLKGKLATVPQMCQLIVQWPAQGQCAQDEWPGVERKFLAAACALLADQADRFYLLESPFRDAKTGKDFTHPSEDRIRRSWQTLLSQAWSGRHE
jgi:hypothetical protein